MKQKVFIFVIVVVVVLLIIGCGGKGKETVKPPTQAPSTSEITSTQPEGATGNPTETVVSNASSADGKVILESKCVKCHTLDRVTSAKKDQAGWTTTVERMMGKGASLSQEEKVILIQYLAENYK